jgi:hypothetical protein
VERSFDHLVVVFAGASSGCRFSSKIELEIVNCQGMLLSLPAS